MTDPASTPSNLQATWRRICVVGAVVVGLADASLSGIAYLGGLPGWLPTQSGGDKVGHLLMFGSLAFFLDGALGYRRLARRAPAFAHLGPIVLWCVVAFDEWAQRFSPIRTSELADLVADTIGIVGFAVISTWIDGWLGRRNASRVTVA